MATEEKNILDGFDMISSTITGRVPIEGFVPIVDDIPEIEPDELKEKLGLPEDDEEIETEETEEEDIDEIIKQNKESLKPKGKETETIVSDEDAETEEMISKLLQERLGSSLNYEFGENEKFSTVQEAVDFLENLVNEASTPNYANEDVAKLDEFVRNGGNLKKYFDSVYERDLDIEDVDITNEFDQKRLIKEALKEQGVKDDMISKRLERIERSETLEEEAIEAQEYLQENKTIKEQKLLKEQKRHLKYRMQMCSHILEALLILLFM